MGNVNNRENENELYSVHDKNTKTEAHSHAHTDWTHYYFVVDDRDSSNNEMICNFINNFINK